MAFLESYGVDKWEKYNEVYKEYKRVDPNWMFKE